MMRPIRPVPLLIALVWHCIHSCIIQRIIDVDHGCHGLAFSSHPLPPARPTAAAQTQSPSFESSAMSWLKREGHAPAAPSPSSSFWPTQLLAEGGSPTSSDDDASWTDRLRRSTRYKPGRVKRVVDASTIQLERGGYVSLADVRGAGGTYRLPDCMDRSPSYRLKQLLPAGTAVRLIDLSDVIPNGGEPPRSSSSPSTTPRVWIVREKDEVIVNRELVGSGFAFVRRGSGSPPAVTDDLIRLERDAKEAGRGIFKSCSANADGTSASDTTDGAVQTSGFVAEFEPLDYTTEIRYGDDGGKQVVVARRDDDAASPPANPGDVKGCSDFDTYEEALGWYEAYLPYYGDVAKLDRDGDGVPCPGLPHTSVGEKYRMKVPKKSVPKQ